MIKKKSAEDNNPTIEDGEQAMEKASEVENVEKQRESISVNVRRALRWSRGVWEKSDYYNRKVWKDTTYSNVYNDKLLRPAMIRAVKEAIDYDYSPRESSPNPHPKRYFDFGCADGRRTYELAGILSGFCMNGVVYGYDIYPGWVWGATQQASFSNFHQISITRDVSLLYGMNGGGFGMVFGSGPVGKFLEKYKLSRGNMSIISSFFVLQELPDIRAYLSTVRDLLDYRGTGIFIIPHPDFVDCVRKNGGICVVKDVAAGVTLPWLWRGRLPIGGNAGYMPYFHRSVDAYLEHFSEFFNDVSYVPLKLDEEGLVCFSLEQGQALDFYDGSMFTQNQRHSFYSSLMKTPSSLLFTLRGRR